MRVIKKYLKLYEYQFLLLDPNIYVWINLPY